jgi:hypothetical protein
MFDSPMEHCAVCGEMVTLDQTLTECRSKQGCAKDQVCPLRRYFTDIEAAPDLRQVKPSIR